MGEKASFDEAGVVVTTVYANVVDMSAYVYTSVGRTFCVPSSGHEIDKNDPHTAL